MAMTVETKLTIQDIRAFVLQRKVYWLRGGAGIPENIVPDQPNIADYELSTQQTQPAPLIGQSAQNKLSSPCSDVMTALGMAAATDPQITIDEAVDTATKNNDTTLLDEARMQAAKIVEDAKAQAQKMIADAQAQTEDIETLPNGRIGLYLHAMHEWHVEKKRLKYEYNVLCKQIDDIMKGYDDVLDYLDELEHRFSDCSPLDNVSYSRIPQQPTYNFDFQDGNNPQ